MYVNIVFSKLINMLKYDYNPALLFTETKNKFLVTAGLC